MGNVIASRGSSSSRHVKVMKLDGEILRFRAPITVEEILQNYPGHVILHSEAVRHLGVRAKPLEGTANLRAKQLYFMVILPKLDDLGAPRRVSSGIHMTAKSRLESMLLARRSVSDISMVAASANPSGGSPAPGEGPLRLKIRLPKARFAELMAQTDNSSQPAEKILDFCLNNNNNNNNNNNSEASEIPRGRGDGVPSSCKKAQRSRVRFSAAQNEEVF